MKHIQSINEFYKRTLGFKYSEPAIKFHADFVFINNTLDNFDEDCIKNTLSDINVKYDSLIIDEEDSEFEVKGELIDVNKFGFDFYVYNEKEVEGIISEFTKSIFINYEIDIVDVLIKECPKI